MNTVLCRVLTLIVVALLGLPGCRGARDEPARNWSQYVETRDGVRLAVDVWLPKRKKSERLPTAVEMTRYHRAQLNRSGRLEDDTNYEEATRWTRAGYAFVIVDARGSGASFGSRDGELSEREIDDYSQVLDWIASQRWSNRRVGAYGSSYSSDTAELLARTRNPRLKAVGLLFGDFDVYEDVVVPGGLMNAAFALPWSLQNDVLDQLPGAVEALAAYYGTTVEELRPFLPSIKPVDGSDGAELLRMAVAEHARNTRLLPELLAVQFRDDVLAGGKTLDSLSPFSYQRDIELSDVPMLALASWMDAGAGRGALSRFATLSNTQVLHLGAWNHGGDEDSDPFKPADAAPSPSPQDQLNLLLEFFDRYVKRGERPNGRKLLRYDTLGEGTWRESAQWPLPASMQSLYLAGGGTLTSTPSPDAAFDAHQVDPSVATGPSNRWAAQASGEDIVYPDRAAGSEQLLTYVTEPFDRATRISGTPIIFLYMAVDQPDAAVFAYLEDVAPDGRVTYITEGQLRLANYQVGGTLPSHRVGRVARSFLREDAAELVPGEIYEIAFDLLPTSVRIARGHRLRLSIAGADADVFLPVSEMPANFEIHRGAPRPSRIEVPVAQVE